MVMAYDDLDDSPPPKPKRTPLPRYQLFIVYLTQVTEPITASVIYPFVNQFVRDTGVIDGDERKTGYYAGVIVSLCATSANSTLNSLFVRDRHFSSLRLSPSTTGVLPPIGSGGVLFSCWGHSASLFPC